MRLAAISRLFFLLVTPLIRPDLYAQSNYPRFENLSGDFEMTERFITRIEQDRQGFLWISSFDGLVKYDGYATSTYKYNPFDPYSVSQNMIYTFLFDKHDT